MLTFLMIGAHPDDMDLRAGGLALRLRARGHRVVFLSATNGDAGHMAMDRDGLRDRRRQEMVNAAGVYGIVYDTLDVEDGYLTPDIPTREKMMRYIRTVRPDVIITHRSCDYHPDHRACGMLVMDCSYLVCVPLFCPDVPALTKAPVILYTEDRFASPEPFRPDLAVPCDELIDRKVTGVLQHRSQFYEWLPYDGKWTEILAASTEEEKTRLLIERLRKRFAGPVGKYPDRFPAGSTYGEVFQIGEYGGAMNDEILTAMIGE